MLSVIVLRFNKERIQLVENLQSACCSPFVISKLLAARMRKLITARARKNNALLACSQMLAKTIRYPFYGELPIKLTVPVNEIMYFILTSAKSRCPSTFTSSCWNVSAGSSGIWRSAVLFALSSSPTGICSPSVNDRSRPWVCAMKIISSHSCSVRKSSISEDKTKRRYDWPSILCTQLKQLWN